MEVTHKISFQMGNAFEQHSGQFTLGSSDMDVPEFENLNLLQKMFVMNALVIVEGLLFQEAEGYISAEDYKARTLRIASMMPSVVLGVFKNVLKSKEDK